MEEEDYPPLIPVQDPGRASGIETRIGELERRTNILVKLGYESMQRDVIVVAGEILKWSIDKRGDSDDDGRHLYDTSPDMLPMVLLGCRAFGNFGNNPNRNDMDAYKMMSQEVIQARNATVHFHNLQALESMVRSCQIGIKEWPMLEEKFPNQARIILKYNAYKTLLPGNFQ